VKRTPGDALALVRRVAARRLCHPRGGEAGLCPGSWDVKTCLWLAAVAFPQGMGPPLYQLLAVVPGASAGHLVLPQCFRPTLGTPCREELCAILGATWVEVVGSRMLPHLPLRVDVNPILAGALRPKRSRCMCLRLSSARSIRNLALSLWMMYCSVCQRQACVFLASGSACGAEI
jgi:hypothetical protein